MTKVTKIPPEVQNMGLAELRTIAALQMDAKLDRERALRARRKASLSWRLLMAATPKGRNK